jgi:hypothetical protein
VILHTCAQRTPEWFALRVGKLTGSCAKDMLARTQKSGEAAARRDLRMRIMAERLSGTSQEDAYVNAAMQWGIDKEADAIAAYQARSRVLVESIGFVEHDDLPVGTSPDGFADEGLLSVKCPKTATHVGYLKSNAEPLEHAAQNTHELWLTKRPWLDFVSFDPRMPDGLRLVVVRVTRTPAELLAYEKELLTFLAECDAETNAILTMANLTNVLMEATAHAV